MTSTVIVVLAVLVLGVSWLGTALLRTYASRRSMIDHPNARSAHAVPTPRGGGLAILVAFLLGLAVLAVTGAVELDVAAGLGGASLIVGAIGFLDDHRDVAAKWRLLAHFAAAAWLLVWLGEPPAPDLLERLGIPEAIAYFVAAIAIVWFINLYNFMDGIDGIASIEAITATGGAIVIGVLAASDPRVPAYLLLIAAVTGFLAWNWPPARIFLGDVGSGFLGVVLAGFALFAGRVDPLFLLAWGILLALFLVDSGLTLIRRALRGERLYEAHRMHAYQHAARHIRSHAAVSAAVAAINLLWLFPIAVAVALQQIDPWIGLALAFGPLVVLALWWKAGVPDPVGP